MFGLPQQSLADWQASVERVLAWQPEHLSLYALSVEPGTPLAARIERGALEDALGKGDYDLSHIQGIPYFYRQFGYEYALPLEGGWRVDLHLVPDPDEGARETLTFRQAETAGSAGQKDLGTLVQLYDAAAQDLSISVRRDAAVWGYLLGEQQQVSAHALRPPGAVWAVEITTSPEDAVRVTTLTSSVASLRVAVPVIAPASATPRYSSASIPNSLMQ